MKLTAAYSEYALFLRIERGLSASTLKEYERDMERYLASLDASGVTDVDEVSSDDVAVFQQSLFREGQAASLA